MSEESVMQARIKEHRKKEVENWNASIPKALQGYDLDSLIEDRWDGNLTVAYTKKFMSYLKNPTKFMVLFGASGLGKTVMGVEVCHKFLADNRVNTARYVDAPTLMAQCGFGSEGAEAVIKEYSRPDILLLDDLGASTVELTATRSTVLWSIINNRWSHGKYTIITTNLPQASASDNSLDISLMDYVGDSAWDRIIESCTTLVFSGKSHRMKRASSKPAPRTPRTPKG